MAEARAHPVDLGLDESVGVGSVDEVSPGVVEPLQ